MKSSRCPIIIDLPKEIKRAQIIPSADMHVGNECFDAKRWAEFEKLIQQDGNYVVFCGDQMEFATKISKSELYSSTRPSEQKRWWIEHLRDYKDKVLAIIDGNHEFNRASKETDSFPLYDIAIILGIEDRYRSEAAFIDIGLGLDKHNKQCRYVGRLNHKAQNLAKYGTVDAFDGIDFFVSGHTHDPMDKPRAKLVYDPHNKTVREKSVENIVCSSFLTYGGYGERNGWRPQSYKMYSLLLDGTRKNIETRGFYL